MTAKEIESFNLLFAAHGFSECSNCKSIEEVLAAVRFLFDHAASMRRKVKAVEAALKE